MSFEKFDLVVIGSGPGGYVAAIRAAQLGLRTACIEKEKTLGGTCLNIGCIPSKALLDSSEHYSLSLHKFKKHGIQFENLSLDVTQMMARKNTIVRQLTGGVAGLFKKNKITSINGTGRLKNVSGETKLIEVQSGDSTQIVESSKVLIATGSEPIELPFLPFDGKKIISSTEALSLSKVPKHLVVVGGGVIGLELGSVWSRLGAKVTVIEFQDKILPSMDQQGAKELKKSLSKQGIEFKLGTKCLGATHTEETIQVEIEDIQSAQKSSIEGDIVLVATGRRPYTQSLGLEETPIQTDRSGRISVNSSYETSAQGVYAIGDVIDGPMLAHKAEEEGIAAVELMCGQAGHVNYDAIPGVVYTWPEFASVGKTEEELIAEQTPYSKGSFPFMANGRAKAMDETEGFVKMLAHKQTDEILGVHIVGPRASDMIAEAVTAIEFNGSAEDLARTSHGHPTLSEALKEAALDVAGRKINL